MDVGGFAEPPKNHVFASLSLLFTFSTYSLIASIYTCAKLVFTLQTQFWGLKAKKFGNPIHPPLLGCLNPRIYNFVIKGAIDRRATDRSPCDENFHN